MYKDQIELIESLISELVTIGDKMGSPESSTQKPDARDLDHAYKKSPKEYTKQITESGLNRSIDKSKTKILSQIEKYRSNVNNRFSEDLQKESIPVINAYIDNIIKNFDMSGRFDNDRKSWIFVNSMRFDETVKDVKVGKHDIISFSAEQAHEAYELGILENYSMQLDTIGNSFEEAIESKEMQPLIDYWKREYTGTNKNFESDAMKIISTLAVGDVSIVYNIFDDVLKDRNNMSDERVKELEAQRSNMLQFACIDLFDTYQSIAEALGFGGIAEATGRIARDTYKDLSKELAERSSELRKISEKAKHFVVSTGKAIGRSVLGFGRLLLGRLVAFIKFAILAFILLTIQLGTNSSSYAKKRLNALENSIKYTLGEIRSSAYQNSEQLMNMILSERDGDDINDLIYSYSDGLAQAAYENIKTEFILDDASKWTARSLRGNVKILQSYVTGEEHIYQPEDFHDSSLMSISDLYDEPKTPGEMSSSELFFLAQQLKSEDEVEKKKRPEDKIYIDRNDGILFSIKSLISCIMTYMIALAQDHVACLAQAHAEIESIVSHVLHEDILNSELGSAYNTIGIAWV